MRGMGNWKACEVETIYALCDEGAVKSGDKFALILDLVSK
jgi:hypothetical protein